MPTFAVTAPWDESNINTFDNYLKIDDEGCWPTTWKGSYIASVMADPWGNAYQYLNPGVHGEIDVFSYGADGAPGGEANDADIGSWNL